LADVSYRDLAAAIGVTEQQLDKYERAVDRVSAARLYRIAQALRVPIAAFFDGLPPALQDVPKPDLQASGAEPNSSGS
jgi:transcriptional regulator with XRE-family HTH domain